ncbi:hypothetical protein PINS_up018470 [Pythium insidiosum]|nr:hypothetical protein PINS_up018470 [Pythium insidiosum]
MACLYKTDGETCTNEDGQQSRCSPLYSCRPLPTPCGAGAKDLQPCGDGYTEFCFPFLGPELRCLNKMEISANLKFDACAGKPDGTPCKAPYLETLYTGAAALYEENGRCSGQVCFNPATVACQGKAIGQGCDFEGALNRKTYRFSGTCKKEFESFAANCDMATKTYIGPATPIKSHPGRDATGPPAPAPEPTQAPTTAPATEAPKPTTASPPVTAAPEPTTARPVTTAPPATTRPAATTAAPTTERVTGSRPGSSDDELKQETTAPSVSRPEILPTQATPTATALRTPLPTLSSAASAADVKTVLATAAVAALMVVQP